MKFANAPKDATHYFHTKWRKRYGNKWYAWENNEWIETKSLCVDDYWPIPWKEVALNFAADNFDEWESSDLEKAGAQHYCNAEKIKKREWQDRKVYRTVGYLPPINVECQFSTDEENWYVCKPMMYSTHAVFLKSHKANEYGCKEYSVELKRVKFRPLQTEAEKLTDQLLDLFTALDAPHRPHVEVIAKWILEKEGI